MMWRGGGIDQGNNNSMIIMGYPFGGRNNFGKTPVLEALFMFFDRLNPQMIFRQFAWRGVNVLSMEPDSLWAPVFNNGFLCRWRF